MDPIEIVPLLIPLSYFVALAIEARWPARAFPPRRGWRWVGVVFLVLIATIGSVVPLLLPLPWMAAHRWIDGTRLGVAGGTFVGWLTLSFVTFPYHRTSHAWSPLWRISHQIHHSPQSRSTSQVRRCSIRSRGCCRCCCNWGSPCWSSDSTLWPRR